MTKEELKQEACDFVNKSDTIYERIVGWDNYQRGAYIGYIAGAKAHSIEWHDLRKDPNDLPKNKRNVWCDYSEGYGKGLYDKDDGGWWIEGHMYCSIINAWCELPKFKE